MEHDLIDDLERRLRAARPGTARADENAFDAELLANVRELPIAARRTVPRAVALPVVAGVTLTVTAVVMLGGGPGEVGGPSSASAVTQALHWLNPPPGTILHTRRVEASENQTTTHEVWQSVDDPGAERELVDGVHDFEVAGGEIYDTATNTIYDSPAAKPAVGDDIKEKAKEGPPEDCEVVSGFPVNCTRKKPVPADEADAIKLKRDAEAANAGRSPAGDKAALSKEQREKLRVAAGGIPQGSKSGNDGLPAGDPIVTKVRMLLKDGRMLVGDREVHDGVDAWPISLKPGLERPGWTLWISAADGKPLELRDPGRDENEPSQVVRWPVYEVVPDTDATQLLTLQGAHPTARVVHDPVQTAEAMERLLGKG